MMLHMITVRVVWWDVGINNNISGRQGLDVRWDECPRAVEYDSKTASSAVACRRICINNSRQCDK
jgi:hypothetical protein